MELMHVVNRVANVTKQFLLPESVKSCTSTCSATPQLKGSRIKIQEDKVYYVHLRYYDDELPEKCALQAHGGVTIAFKWTTNQDNIAEYQRFTPNSKIIGLLEYSWSECNPLYDQFVKEIGRAKSRGRLLSSPNVAPWDTHITVREAIEFVKDVYFDVKENHLPTIRTFLR